MKHGMLISGIALVLAGCGGGGGGGSADRAFEGISKIPANGTVAVPGEARRVNYTASGTDFDNIEISDISAPLETRIRLTHGNEEPRRVEISSGDEKIVFDAAQGDELEALDYSIVAMDAEGKTLAALSGGADGELEYQVFGAWLTGYGTGSGTVGVASTGMRSAQVPRSGNAEYRGTSVGVLKAADGKPYMTASDVHVETDFSTLEVHSYNTAKVNLNTEVESDASDVDFTAVGTVSGGGFAGTVKGDIISGDMSGYFFGPNAEEVGGTFTAEGGGNSYAGTFGAAQGGEIRK
ncbi:transferrin binding protein [Rhodovulum imhoffii]|uniref:Transferrin binding protein n=1 Tax=Rhodovulum imhoffii TaxID=365340 RepID=A0A2T5BVD5_9RHOB|nr:transferrin-binding protein-like solute binding protein [Rhodovulum imhoffii]MBK5934210.1 hypothetical protein [Rhodovulum imhoffii]PTN03543.1 transferrin binding protein [Rhodovulum imhoffii]